MLLGEKTRSVCRVAALQAQASGGHGLCRAQEAIGGRQEGERAYGGQQR